MLYFTKNTFRNPVFQISVDVPLVIKGIQEIPNEKWEDTFQIFGEFMHSKLICRLVEFIEKNMLAKVKKSNQKTEYRPIICPICELAYS